VLELKAKVDVRRKATVGLAADAQDLHRRYGIYSPAVAIYDACILYPFHLRNIMVQMAIDGLVDARWTDAIHDEWMRNLLANTGIFRPSIWRARGS